MPTPARELTDNRLLIVANAQAVYVEAAHCFADLGFPVDRTRSFDTATLLLSHLNYSAVVVCCSPYSAASQEQLFRLEAMLQRAHGTPVILLSPISLPAHTEYHIRRDVSLYFDRTVPLPEIAEAVRCLLRLTSKGSAARHIIPSAERAC
jgi:hypothetical protein